MRLFNVTAAGTLTLRGLTLSNGLAQGGDGGDGALGDGGGGGGGAGLGGAVFNAGTLNVVQSTLSGNTASGGDGGNGSPDGAGDDGGGGGGGGLSGNGGHGVQTGTNGEGGGGGGGVFGNGGSAIGDDGDGGGGGGGTLTDGADTSTGTGGAGGVLNGGAGGSTTGTGAGAAGGPGGGGGGGAEQADGFDGGAGGFGGGGGGSSENDGSIDSTNAGAGGFGGGGGGGGEDSNGGAGGFGGGGGGASDDPDGPVETSGLGGFGAGNGAPLVGGGSIAGGGGGGLGAGGAIFNHGGTVTITNSAISGNTARGGTGGNGTSAAQNGLPGQGLGGGVFNHNGTLTILNGTLTANQALDAAGAPIATGGRQVFNLGNGNADRDTSGTVGTATVSNAILGQADAAAEDFTGQSVGGGTSTTGGVGNLIRTQSGFAGTIVSTADPLLGPLVSNGGPTQTHLLGEGSPAIDAGDNAAAVGLTADQRGFVPRRFNGLVDVGAVEVGAGAGNAVVAVGTGNGEGGTVNLDDGSRISLVPFPGFVGEVRVGRGDVTGDGVLDLVFAAGNGSVGGHVKVFDGATGAEVRSFFAFEGFAGGATVAGGDVNGDGIADLIVGAGAGAIGGHVKVFSGADGSLLHSFFAFAGFPGEVRVAAGDVNGDGLADVIVGAGPGHVGGHVKVFDGATGAEIRSFFAFAGFGGGVFVGAGDLDGDGVAEIFVGADAGAGPHVKAFGAGDEAILSFFAYGSGFVGGVRVSGMDRDGDGDQEVVTGNGPGAPGHLTVVDGDLSVLDSLFVTDPVVTAGIFVR
jgi:hypothetical protein